MARYDMTRSEVIEMMKRASADIKALRAQIADLRPRADAYDRLAQVLDLLPTRNVGMAEDVAWLLDRRVAELEGAMHREDNARAANAAQRERELLEEEHNG